MARSQAADRAKKCDSDHNTTCRQAADQKASIGPEVRLDFRALSFPPSRSVSESAQEPRSVWIPGRRGIHRSSRKKWLGQPAMATDGAAKTVVGWLPTLVEHNASEESAKENEPEKESEGKEREHEAGVE